MKSQLSFILLVWVSLLRTPTYAQPQTGLFEQQTILDLELKMNMKEVMRDINDDRRYHLASLSYLTPDGERVWLPVRVKTRGNTRRNPEVCSFAPLRLNFKKSETEKSLFEGQDKLKLVTHCQPRESFKVTLAKEYLIYQQYRQLTEYSMRARLARITYIDSESKVKPLNTMAFIIEDIDQVANRTDSKEVKKDLHHQDQCDQQNLDLMVMFQFMIGHTDWGVSKGHNIKLLINSDQVIIPVPYDFDYSGLINVPYAVPDPTLGIRDVRTRIFRGYCRLPGTYEETIKKFQEKRTAMYQVYQNSEILDPKQAEEILAYFDKFYEILADPKKVRNQINRACNLSHKHLYQN